MINLEGKIIILGWKFWKQLEDKLKREQRKLSKRLLIAKKENRKLSEAKNYQKLKIIKNKELKLLRYTKKLWIWEQIS